MGVPRLAAHVALVAAWLAALGALLPIPPQFIANQLDAGFGATLHFAAAHHYAAGVQLISTFGPLGFVFYDCYFPTTFAWLIAIRTFLAVVTCWTVAWLGSAAGTSPWGATIGLIAVIPYLASPDTWFLILPLLALLVDLPADGRAPWRLRLALGAAIGVASLIKFTFLLAAIVALVPLLISGAFSRRLDPLPIAAVGTAALAWAALGSGAAAALAYVDWSVRDISAGYARAMQLPADVGLTAHALAVSAAVLAAGVWLIWRRHRPGWWAHAAGLAAGLFVLFKAGFVRFDVHVYLTIFGLLVLAILFALLWARRPAQIGIAIALIALAPGALYVHGVALLRAGPLMYFHAVSPIEGLQRLAALPLMLDPAALDQADARQRQRVRSGNPLPAIAGTADIYPIDQGLLLAHGLNFQPRPVPQSYMAYSRRLAEANAAALLAADAPQWIFFRVAPIDHHWPSLEDGLSWPILLSRYELVDGAGAFAVLRRRAAPLGWYLEPRGAVRAHTGELISVPVARRGPIWARVDVHETERDAVLAAVFAGPILRLRADRADGVTGAYRLLPAVAREGFLLSPLIDDTTKFARLATSRDIEPGYAVTAMRVEVADTPGVTTAARDVDVAFFDLVIDDAQTAAAHAADVGGLTTVSATDRGAPGAPVASQPTGR